MQSKYTKCSLFELSKLRKTEEAIREILKPSKSKNLKLTVYSRGKYA